MLYSGVLAQTLEFLGLVFGLMGVGSAVEHNGNEIVIEFIVALGLIVLAGFMRAVKIWSFQA